MFKQTITNAYGQATFKTISKLQETKKKSCSAKTRWIFLMRCVTNKVLPKSFCSRPLVKSKKALQLTFDYNLRMLKLACNEAKQRYHELLNSIKQITSALQNILNEDDFNTTVRITESYREKVYTAMSTRLKEKFDHITGKKTPTRTTSIVKPAVLNLTSNEIPESHLNLLNLGPTFVPALKKVPIMSIVTATEAAAQKIEKKLDAVGHCVESESLRHNVSNILLKQVKKRLPSNLSREQHTALRELKDNNDIKIVPFDKGVGFAVLTKEGMLDKMKDHLGEAKTVEKDPTNTIVVKFQKELSRLKKEKKIDQRCYEQIYPSDAVPPRLYGYVKAHKATKNFPMRPVVSTIGTPFYGTSKHLVDIIQPTLNKSNIRVKNSSSFVEESKTWQIDPDEVQVSYDVVNLYPSVPISKSIDSIINLLQSDHEDVKARTNLSIPDIRKLLELCLSKCYFLYEDSIYVIEDAGPIGLSLMVVVAEAYLQTLEAVAIQQATDCVPISFRRYVDDSHARFSDNVKPTEFLDILNAQDSKIQYTIEREEVPGKLSFLDVTIINNKSGRYQYKIHRKEATTNLQIKPNSSVNPNTIYGIFKGFLARAYMICSNQHLAGEIAFLLDMFVENGYDREKLKNIVSSYKHNAAQQDTDNDSEREPVVSLPWIPKVGPKLRSVYRRHGIKVVFHRGPSLKDILSQHKSKLPKNSNSGVYRLQCGCSNVYIGETKKRILTRAKEHQRDAFEGRWSNSGAAEHAKTCQHEFQWNETKSLAMENDKTRRKIREALEIRKHKRLRQAEVLNRDSGTHLITNQWDYLLGKSDVS